jgi:hypothetical protein
VRSPIDVLAGRVGGFQKMEIARRTVPCYKHVIEKEGERLSVCLLVDSGKLYRFPFASFSPGFAAMSKEQTKPSESLVQGLLAERRELKVMVERLKLELAEANPGGGEPDPRLREMQDEIERLRYQLASARAEANHMREDRDELRGGIERALQQLAEE